MIERAESRASASDPRNRRRLFLILFVVLFAIYLPTSSLSRPLSPDPVTNSLTAYLIAENGSPIADGYESLTSSERQGGLTWLVPSPRGPVSRYPPGAALLAVPIYLVADVELIALGDTTSQEQQVALPEMWPAAVVASATTAAAVAVLGVILFDLGVQRRHALGAALVVGLGTSLWSVAANALWQHGPAAMFIMVGLLMVSRKNLWFAGWSFAGAVLVRPQVVIPIAVLVITIGLVHRSFRSMLSIGLPASLGATGYLIYNFAVFGSWLPRVAGGYAIQAAGSSPYTRLGAIVDTLLDPYRGLLIHSPILVVALVATFSNNARREPWLAGAAIGGLLYILFQARPGDFAGGSDFWSYRYPLEGLVFAAPLLALSTVRWMASRPIGVVAVAVAVSLSIALHGFGTIAIQL